MSATYHPGDIIKVERTMRVDDALVGGAFRAHDVSSGLRYTVEHSGSIKIQMVKRAVRPAPKDGDVLTGYQVRERIWKRGTSIHCVDDPEHLRPSPLFLLGTGAWIDSNDTIFEFEDLNDEAHFKLLHVAQ